MGKSRGNINNITSMNILRSNYSDYKNIPVGIPVDYNESNSNMFNPDMSEWAEQELIYDPDTDSGGFKTLLSDPEVTDSDKKIIQNILNKRVDDFTKVIDGREGSEYLLSDNFEKLINNKTYRLLNNAQLDSMIDIIENTQRAYLSGDNEYAKLSDYRQQLLDDKIVRELYS